MKNNLLVIALLVAFASCKKDEVSKSATQLNSKLLGDFTCTITGGNSSHSGTGHGTLRLSYSNGEYYLKSVSGVYGFSSIDSARIEISGNTFTIPTHTEDSIWAVQPDAYLILNGTGTISDTTMYMHYTVDEFINSGVTHNLYVYDLTGTK